MIKQLLAGMLGLDGAKSFEGITFSSLKSFAGVDVTIDRAMQHSAVFACVRDKAEAVGQLPIKMYRINPTTKKREQVVSGREYRIFTQTPNDFQTMNDMAEMCTAWLETQGNFYAYVVRNRFGNVSEIIPFFNQRNVSVNEDRGRVYYTYVTNDGKGGMYRDWIESDNIMHVKLFAMNGYLGMSPISNNSRALGVSMAQEEYLGALMESGAMPLGVLTTPKVMKDDKSVERIRNQWKEKFGGAKKAGNTPLLENDLKYQALSISPADSELIAQRRFSREDLCAIFKVPYTRLYPAEKASNTTVEEDNTRYLTTGLMPDIRKFEQEVSKLMPDHMSIQLDVKEFLRGDLKTMQEFVGGTFKLGAISMNEMRESLGWDEKEGGDVHAIDTNNLTFGMLTDIPKLQQEARAQALATPSAANAVNEEKPDEA